jgi:hypothetical protein
MFNYLLFAKVSRPSGLGPAVVDGGNVSLVALKDRKALLKDCKAVGLSA